jgi:signal peptidase II
MRDRAALFFIIALVVFVLDQATKYLIKSSVGPLDVIRILPFFNIIYAENIGSAFGMFKSLGNTFFIVVALFAMGLITFLIFREREHRLSFSLILGGAAGNLADRMIYGYVVDFLDLYTGRHHWPTFNVADSALTIGMVLLIIRTLISGLKHK